MRFAAIALLFTSTCFAQDDGEADDKTGKVFESLADYTVNRDAVMKRCAFFAVGEVQRASEAGAPKTSQHFWSVYSNSSRSINYRANCSWPHLDRKWMQVWHEILSVPGVRKGRARYWNQGEFKKQKAGEKRFDFRQRATGAFMFVDPFENIFRANALIDIFPERNCLEDYFLNNGELKSSVIVGGVLHTEWLLWGKKKLKMKQSQTQGLMPIEISSSDAARDEITRIKWENKDNLWVPTHIRSSDTLRDSNLVSAVFAKFDWKIGKEVKAINPKADSIYPALVEQFGVEVDRQVDGQYMPGSKFVAPPDLFVDLEDARKKQRGF